MTTETVKFKIELYAQHWDKPPVAEILINGESKHKQEITSREQEPTVIEFEHKLTEGEQYTLALEKTNKDDSQTVVENGKIVKDQLLFIKSITIDSVDLGGLIYEGKYYPRYPEPWATQQREQGQELSEYIKNVTSLGWDGRWEITFSSPFYMWLLENLY